MGNYIIMLAVLVPVVVELVFVVKRYYFVVVFCVLAAIGQWLEKFWEA